MLNYQEEEARGVFQAGNAAFMRNWPYAWSLAQGADSPVKGKVGIVPLPKGGADGQNAAALGGQLLAVSKYSKNPDVAIDLVMYLTGPEEQKRRAVVGSFNPTIPALFKDADIQRRRLSSASCYEVFSSCRRAARLQRPAGTTTRSRASSLTRRIRFCRAESQPDRALAELDARPQSHQARRPLGVSVEQSGPIAQRESRRGNAATAKGRTGTSRLTRSRVRAAWLFISPMLVVLALVAGWPLARTIWFSFTDADLSNLNDYALRRLRQLPRQL